MAILIKRSDQDKYRASEIGAVRGAYTAAAPRAAVRLAVDGKPLELTERLFAENVPSERIFLSDNQLLGLASHAMVAGRYALKRRPLGKAPRYRHFYKSLSAE
jgi:hypothetical protein